MKRPAGKIKLDVVKPPSSLHFSESVGKGNRGVYVTKLSEALNQSGCVVIAEDDHYMKHQLTQAAKKLKVRLVYALADKLLYVKPLAIDGEKKRLLLLLREPRTVNELMVQKLELNIVDTLADLEKQKFAHFISKNGVTRWVLTEQGMDALL